MLPVEVAKSIEKESRASDTPMDDISRLRGHDPEEVRRTLGISSIITIKAKDKGKRGRPPGAPNKNPPPPIIKDRSLTSPINTVVTSADILDRRVLISRLMEGFSKDVMTSKTDVVAYSDVMSSVLNTIAKSR